MALSVPVTRERTQDPDETALVQAAQAGRLSAFEELVRLHQVRVVQLCASMLADPSEAEDAAQDAFLKAWQNLQRFEGGSSFGTWLYRIAANHCLDLLRKRARRRTDSLDELVEREGGRLAGLFSSRSEPSLSLEAADLTARLLETLPEEQRVALILRETQGLRYDEIARVMDCTADSVRGRLKRARETLLKSLRHFTGGPGV